MPRKQIKRKCGHIENIYLEDREFNDPAALKHHEDEICEKCYVSTNCVYEKRMSYFSWMALRACAPCQNIAWICC